MVKVDRLLICNCEGSMKIDAASAGASIAAGKVKSCSHLCSTELDVAASALQAEGSTVIACGQQAALFEDLASELEAPGKLLCADIRDRAGWTEDKEAFAKQAALLAEAALDQPVTPLRDIISSGVCLLAGAPDLVLPLAERLSTTLSVTCLLSEPTDAVPNDRYEIALGRIVKASGAFGDFKIEVDGYAPLSAGGRGAGQFAAPKDGAKSQCDLIFDLTGGTPLFPAPEKRDGYLRADPRDALAVERTASEASQLVGEFDKPIYIRFDASVCAHSRASQTGCNRCLNVCPTGAIVPAGDTVEIDPDICAGCGACASVCPSGAASYDDPPATFLFQRLRVLADAYGQAGGTTPRILFHDETFGAEMIALSARFGRGLPADVIPLGVRNLETIGHAEVLAALTTGFDQVCLLMSPKTDQDVVTAQIDLAKAVLEAGDYESDLVQILDVPDPDALEERLYSGSVEALNVEKILPMGDRRNVTRLAATALVGADAQIDLPQGAPYGALDIDTDSCTMCLACVSLCPVGALLDNPDMPQLKFQESACLQCGICASTCPENAITLEPRLNLSNEAIGSVVLNEEEPFDCISCGKPFGVKSTIERIMDKLKDKHAMFTNSDNHKLIQMCDDCRVNAQYHQDASPFKLGERPAVRTTQDYLDERKKT